MEVEIERKEGEANKEHYRKLTLTSSGFPHSPSLKVSLTWLLVGRNSKPNSSHGVSSSALPGRTLAAEDDKLLNDAESWGACNLLVEIRDDGWNELDP